MHMHKAQCMPPCKPPFTQHATSLRTHLQHPAPFNHVLLPARHEQLAKQGHVLRKGCPARHAGQPRFGLAL